MADRTNWADLRDARMAEPGAAEAYRAARLAFELGVKVRELRRAQGWTQEELAVRSGLTQPAVARLEGGGTVPTLPVLTRLAEAFGTELEVTFKAA